MCIGVELDSRSKKRGLLELRKWLCGEKHLPCEFEYPEPTQGQTHSSGSATSVLPQEDERQTQESP